MDQQKESMSDAIATQKQQGKHTSLLALLPIDLVPKKFFKEIHHLLFVFL